MKKEYNAKIEATKVGDEYFFESRMDNQMALIKLTAHVCNQVMRHLCLTNDRGAFWVAVQMVSESLEASTQSAEETRFNTSDLSGRGRKK